MRKGITRRWMVNGFAVIVGFLVIVEIAFMVAVRSYYYQGVETALSNRAETYRNSVSMSVAFSNLSAGTVDLSQRAQELVERFNNKEKMELQVLDKTGAALISSTGFVPAIDLNMEDFKRALQAGSNDRGVWTGKNANRENVMAYTLLERDQNGNVIGALRYVVSLTLVDRQVWILVGVMLLFGVVIVFFVALSSSYFISSIVNPVTEIGRAARRIALGEYDFRIEKKYDDEIGELCDTLNYMAGEIDTAERMKNDFISSVSHELRTPLTAIKGWSETLRQVGPDDTEMMEKGLDVIAGEAERLSGIVEELLDFSRMQSGHLMMKFGRTDVVAEPGGGGLSVPRPGGKERDRHAVCGGARYTAGAGGSGPSQAGVHQRAGQRYQIFQRRRENPGGGGGYGRPRADCGQRHRRGHLQGGFAEYQKQVLQGQ